MTIPANIVWIGFSCIIAGFAIIAYYAINRSSHIPLVNSIDMAAYYFKRRGIRFVAAAGIFAFTVTAIFVWFSAFFSGGEILVSVNAVNEAYVELFIFCFVIPCMLYSAIYHLRGMKQDVKMVRRYWSKHTGNRIPIDTMTRTNFLTDVIAYLQIIH